MNKTLSVNLFRVSFKSPENQATLDRLVREVKALNQDFLTHQVSGKSINIMYVYNIICHVDAAYRYYRSCCEQKSIERRGINSVKLRQKRKNERLSRVCLFLA